jgi:hypothetical protein
MLFISLVKGGGGVRGRGAGGGGEKEDLLIAR